MPATVRQHFEDQVKALQQDVMRMGSHVIEMLDLAIQALIRQDLTFVDRAIQMDDIADEMDLRIEQTCLRLLALQQPMSKDLRIISSALKIITDLERIGDYSVDIAKTARRMVRAGHFKPVIHIPHMADCTKALVTEAVQAYVNSDLDRVARAVAMDDAVDLDYDCIFTELLEHVEGDPTVLRQAIWFSQIIRFLERIADHAVNVAERVYFMETGQFVQLAKSHQQE